jgi:hypothetical protein
MEKPSIVYGGIRPDFVSHYFGCCDFRNSGNSESGKEFWKFGIRKGILEILNQESGILEILNQEF